MLFLGGGVLSGMPGLRGTSAGSLAGLCVTSLRAVRLEGAGENKWKRLRFFQWWSGDKSG